MNRACASLAAALALWGAARAHRLDECLQATRLKLETNRVALRIDITPGVAVVQEFLERLDADRDSAVSDAERVAYGEVVLGELSLYLDGRPLQPRLDRTQVSSMEELRAGTGSVRLSAHAEVAALPPGQHHLTLTNRHLSRISVHLVNALQPTDPRLEIREQVRSRDQREYRVEFEVAGRVP